VPIRISIISPIPFCPSFDPCAKLTPVQLSISSARIQNGGGAAPSGASYSVRSLITAFDIFSSSHVIAKPISGDSTNAYPIFAACPQSTPLVPLRPLIN